MQTKQGHKGTILKTSEASLQMDDVNNTIRYWRKKLTGLEPLQMPTDYPRAAKQSYYGGIRKFYIEMELYDQLRSLSDREQTTMFMVMLAAFNALLFRYSAQEDICVGTRVATATQLLVKDMVEFFNTLVLRSDVNGECTFTELLQQVKTTTIEACGHQKLSFEKMVETVVNEKNFSCSPLFRVQLVLQNTPPVSNFQFDSLNLPGTQPVSGNENLEITFLIKKAPTDLEFIVEYKTHLYKKETIDRLAFNFKELLYSIVKSPWEKVVNLKMLTGREEHQILVGFNESEVAYPRDKNIVDLFEEQVIKNPGKIAVVFEKEKLTYQELNIRSNQLARYLQICGVKEETLIPICMERCLEMLIGILGILKTGAAYVPVDPEYPEDRINYMLEDTSASIVISSKISRGKLNGSSEVDIIEIDGHWPGISKLPEQNLNIIINSHSLAYVIYTSGSTGKPKGVMIEHQAILDHCFGLIKSAQLNNCLSFALFSPLVFDAGHSIIFTSIFLGASLHVLSKQLIVDGEKLVDYLKKSSIDCIKIVPSVWISYINENNIVLSNKVMIFGGEGFSGKILEHLKKLKYAGDVYNHYGPTEATIGKCIHKIDLQRPYNSIPIGKPFSNTQLYIVDKWDQIIPIGVAGELYIAGEGLAREYLHRPDLTAEKFISNPFYVANPFNSGHDTRIYKTGDKVRWNNDGEIEYIGRVDEQVKIGGHRIELGEIENVLAQIEGVKHAAVQQSAVGDDENKILIGYVVVKGLFDKQMIISQLQSKLPEYMIPGLWVELTELPLTPNGKVNKKALPKPDVFQLLKGQYVARGTKLNKH